MLVVLTEYKVPRELGTLNYIYFFFIGILERQQCNTQTQRKVFCVIVQEFFDYFADYTTKKIDSTKNRSSHNRSKKSIILAVWIDYCQNRLKIGNTSSRPPFAGGEVACSRAHSFLDPADFTIH
jgi:hypothetical protein